MPGKSIDVDGRIYWLERDNMLHSEAVNYARGLRRRSRVVTHGNYRPVLARVVKSRNGKWAVYIRDTSLF